MEKTKNIDENCFVSPAVSKTKKDKSVKKALDSRKLNETTKKGRHKCQIWKNYYRELPGKKHMD